MTKKIKRAPQEQLTRKQRSRLEKERHMQRLLLWGLSIVAVLTIGVLGYGVVAESILEPRQPVAIVDGQGIPTSEFQARVKHRRSQLQNQLLYLYQQYQAMMREESEEGTQGFEEYFEGQISELESWLAPENAEAIGQQVLEQMIQEKLAQMEAERRGIEVTEDQVQDAIHEGFGYDPEAAVVESAPTTETEPVTPEEPVPAPTPMTEAEFNELYDRHMREGLQPLGISEQQYRSWIEASLLVEALQEAMKEELPTEAEQLKLRLLVVSSEERAEQMVERLDGGEDFDVLVEEAETDDEELGYGSELDWMPTDMVVDQLGHEMAELVLALDVGGYTEPVPLGEQDDPYAIIILTGREIRPLEESIREQMAAEAFQSWLQAQETLVERRPIRDRVPAEP